MNVEVRPIKTAAETALATNFAMAKRALPGAPAVAALREDAFRRFESEGLPHRRVEEIGGQHAYHERQQNAFDEAEKAEE